MGCVRGVGGQAHPWRPPRHPEAGHQQQHLHPEPMPAVGLQDLGAGVVVQGFAGQRIGDLFADVVVTDAPGVRIPVRALANLR